MQWTWHVKGLTSMENQRALLNLFTLNKKFYVYIYFGGKYREIVLSDQE